MFGIIDSALYCIKTSFCLVDTHSEFILCTHYFNKEYHFHQKWIMASIESDYSWSFCIHDWDSMLPFIQQTWRLFSPNKKLSVICPLRIQQIKMQMCGIYFQHAKTLKGFYIFRWHNLRMWVIHTGWSGPVIACHPLIRNLLCFCCFVFSFVPLFYIFGILVNRWGIISKIIVSHSFEHHLNTYIQTPNFHWQLTHLNIIIYSFITKNKMHNSFLYKCMLYCLIN
jgi:hypothetical protein